MMVDVVIVSNGPGELITWVRPVVLELRKQLDDVRISIILCPCPHATGKEARIAEGYPVDRVLSAKDFFGFLLLGKTPGGWDWFSRGVVLFLGGDQVYPVVIGKRLGYLIVVYAEWEARWGAYVDHFALMNDRTLINECYRSKSTVVGDLIAEVRADQTGSVIGGLIGLLPGSKPAKLAQGVPLTLAIAEALYNLRPESRFVIPLAATVEPEMIAFFADPKRNRLIDQNGWVGGVLDEGRIITTNGLVVPLDQTFPPYVILSQCELCVTTVGANTAELGALGIPMIILLPTQQLDAMRSWDGLGGILANLPVVGSVLAKLINMFVLRQGRLFGWPNIWAQRRIVPELVGKLDPVAIAGLIDELLSDQTQLEQMRDDLRAFRGEPGAARQIVGIVARVLSMV